MVVSADRMRTVLKSDARSTMAMNRFTWRAV